MAIFCIPRHITQKLKDAAAKGEIKLEDIYKMNPKQAHDFWLKFVNEETAQFINAGFQKAMVSEQQSALENWVRNTFSIKDKKAQKNAIDKVAELSQSGALNPDNKDNFMSDLIAEKLGVTVSPEEAERLDAMSAVLQEAAKTFDEYGLLSNEYFVQREKIDKYLKSLVPTNKLKVFTSIIGRANMLWSIKSPIVNIVGNTVQQLESRMEKRIASNNYSGKVDKNLMKGYIKRANEIFKKSGFDVTRMNSYSDGVKVLGEDLVHSEGTGLTRKIGRFYEDKVFKQLMSAPDVYFSSISFADTANLGATKMAKDEGLSGQALVDRANEIFKDATSVTPKTVQGEFLRETAIADALVATFQDDTNYSRLSLGIRKLLNDASGDARFGDQIMPFVKTPANVVGMTLDAGGLGAVKGFYDLPRAIREMKGGDPALMRKVAKNFTRSGLGMVIAFLISSVFDPDDFIGRYPTSKSEQELLTTKKARENSLKIGGKWISLDYLGFLGGPLVGFLYAKKYGKDLPSAMYAYGSGVLIQATKIPGFDEFRDVVDNLSKLKPEEGEGLVDTLDKFKASGIDYLRSRIVPGWVADLAKAIDTSEREVDSKSPSDKIKANIPGLRQDLKEKKDIFGAVIKGEPWWSVALFGARVQTARDSKIISEIDRLNEAGFIPVLTRPEKTANSRMAQLKEQLGDDKFSEANSFFRDEYMKNVSKKLDSYSYERLSNEDKKKAIDKIRDDAINRTLSRFRYQKPKKEKEVINTSRSMNPFAPSQVMAAESAPKDVPFTSTQVSKWETLNAKAKTIEDQIKIVSEGRLISPISLDQLMKEKNNIRKEQGDLVNYAKKVDKVATPEEKAVLPVYDKYEIPKAVIFGMSSAEGGVIGKNNVFNVGAYDKSPKSAVDYATKEEGAVAIAKLLSGTFKKENGQIDTKYKAAWENRSDPVKMLKMIEAAGFAGPASTWVERSKKEGGAATKGYKSWSDFIMDTPAWKKWIEVDKQTKNTDKVVAKLKIFDKYRGS